MFISVVIFDRKFISVLKTSGVIFLTVYVILLIIIIITNTL